MASGTIFDLQRLVTRSGATRVLVYFKGCPLRCLWCSNPESHFPGPELLLRPERCTDCGRCQVMCVAGAVVRAESGARLTDRTLCTVCGACARSCEAEARTLSGRTVTVTGLLEELEGMEFSGFEPGIVSLTGGEPVMQPAFAAELLRQARRRGLRTVLETSGHAPWLDLARILPYADLVLYDIKHHNPYLHRRLTGARNDLVLANLERAAKSSTSRIVLRLPLVPGCNADEDTVRAIAELARDLAIADLHLVPYHRRGEWKYRALSRGYPLDGAVPLSDEVVDELRRIAERVKGPRVRISG